MNLRRTLLSLIMLFSLVASTSAAESVFPYRCQKEVLPNGLTVLMIPMPGSGPGFLLHRRAHRQPRRGRARPLRLSPTSSST